MNELCFIFSLDSNPVLVLISWIWTLLRGKFSFRYHNSMHFSFPSLLMNTKLNHIECRANKVTNCWLESSKFRFFRVIKLKKFEFSIHPHLHFPHEGIRFRIFTVFSWFDNVSVFQHFNKAEVIDFTLIVIVRLCYWQLQFLTLIFCSLIASLLPFSSLPPPFSCRTVIAFADRRRQHCRENIQKFVLYIRRSHHCEEE